MIIYFYSTSITIKDILGKKIELDVINWIS